MSFNPGEYWEKRLSADYSLRGVGDLTLGFSFNRYIYRVRKYVFDRLIRKAGLVIKGKKIVEIGPGTGFYVEQYKQYGCANLNGIDITEKAVNELSQKYPAYSFFQRDIGSAEFDFPNKDFDIASSFDVLYHIVDDRRFENALRNISTLVKPGGIFLYSDYFLPKGQRFEVEHQVCRDINYITGILAQNGFTIEKKVPMFVLMNTSFTDNYFLKRFFNKVEILVRKGEIYGRIFGAILYPVELLLVSTKKKSSSTEILVCRKDSEKSLRAVSK